MSRDLSRLLRPRSLAVMGGSWAENVIAQARSLGFLGPVWPVHPDKPTIGGVPAFPALAALPEAPDAVFIGVNRHATVDIVAELSAMGAGGAIAFASGWREAGDHGLQERLVRAAGNMPVLGPNCYGLINCLDGAVLWPDQHGTRRVSRGVAILSQSSNIAINLTMQRRGLPVAYVACIGNAAQIGLAELAEALLAEERVTALGLHVEGIGDAGAFAAVAEAARAAGKGIVCVKSGKTEASRAAAASHTAALAGAEAASSAFLAQCGVAEVATLSELLETLKIFHVHGPIAARRVCSLSCSGGEAGLVADLAAGHALAFPPPDPGQAAALGEILGPLVSIANPLDYHTFIWGDEARTTAVFSTMLAGYDAGLFVIDPPRPDRCDPASFEPALVAIANAATSTGKPAFPVSSLPENFDEARAEAMIAGGVAPLMGLETALGAVAAAATPPGRAGWRPLAPRVSERSVRLLGEDAAKRVLADAGVAVPRLVAAPTLAGLAAAAKGLKPPLALKGLGFAHKTEAGAVRLGVMALEAEPPIPGAAGYLAEEMVGDGLAEVLVGAVRDPVYGVTLTLGFGGVTAELIADTVTLVAPVDATGVGQALRRLRLWPLLDGYRGRPKPDVTALVDVALALQSLMQDRPELVEIEINPLILRARGAVAVDALIREET